MNVLFTRRGVGYTGGGGLVGFDFIPTQQVHVLHMTEPLHL